MNFTISKELIEAIANYLSGQPYQQVAGMIDAIKQITPIEIEAKED